VIDSDSAWHAHSILKFQGLRSGVPEDTYLAASAPNEFVTKNLCESLLAIWQDASPISACLDHVHGCNATEASVSIVHDNRGGRVCDHVFRLFQQLLVRPLPVLFRLEHDYFP
jgi:hypothetical protein